MPKSNAQGTALIRQMALEALNRCQRNRQEARSLVMQWGRENEALYEALASPALDQAFTIAIGRDLCEERKDVVRMARAAPSLTNSVAVGPNLLPAFRTGCLPIPSDVAQARAAANVVHYEGLVAFKLPLTGKPLGAAKAWEIRDAFQYCNSQRKGFAVRARFLELVRQSLPDRELPESEQRPLIEHLGAAELKALDERALIEEEKVIL